MSLISIISFNLDKNSIRQTLSPLYNWGSDWPICPRFSRTEIQVVQPQCPHSWTCAVLDY